MNNAFHCGVFATKGYHTIVIYLIENLAQLLKLGIGGLFSIN